MIQLPVGTKVWIAAGMTDLRRGFDGLSAPVQNVLHEQPFSGHVFVFVEDAATSSSFFGGMEMDSVC